MRWLAAVGVLAGCYRPGADPACSTRCTPGDTSPTACPGSLVCAEDGTCRGPDDTCVDADGGGPVDMRPDDSSPFCYGQGLLRICVPEAPTGAPVFVSSTIDTSILSTCMHRVPQAGGPELCVIAAGSISMVNVSVRGTRPLVLIATGPITLSGSIDVASRRFEPANPAAGSNDSTCVGTNNPLGQAGGNGGSFGGSGGRGGRSGSFPQAPVDPAVLRGGCPGVNGNGNGAAVGGRGGGAIYFIAGTSINVGTASINASGSGGTSAVASAGGGGGSGGMIGFDAPAIEVSMGEAFANGGGGAGGTTGSVAGNGGESTNYATAGAGGASTGASGGEGSLVSVDGAPGEGISTNGGGGGGGAGVIVIYPPSQAAAFGGATSPPVTL